MLKWCNVCKTYKPADEFGTYVRHRPRHDRPTYSRKGNPPVPGSVVVESSCRPCRRARVRKGYDDRQSKRGVGESGLAAFVATIINRIRGRSKANGIPFDLSVPWVVEQYALQGGICPITGLVITYDPRLPRQSTNLSVDRIASGGPYTRENCRLVTRIGNTIRWQMTDAELLVLCRGVVATLGKGET